MSSSNIKLPPLRNNNNNKEEGVDLVQLKQRFDKQLPKYGFMWRSMNNARLAQEKAATKPTSTSIVDNKQQNGIGEDKENNIIPPNIQKEEEPSLLDAILTKQPVQLGIHNSELCGEDCNCAEPIIEIDNDNIDENNSVYDVDVDEELADTEDEEEEKGSGSIIKSSGKVESEEDVGDKSNESVGGDMNINSSMSSEESIVLVSKTPKKKKMVIIDSDEESEFEEEDLEDNNDLEEQEAVSKSIDGAFTLSDADDESIVQSTSPKKKRSTRLRNSKAKSLQILDNNDDDSEDLKSTTSSEEEWIELSSDEEEAVAPKQDLTVVILSDDDDLEESMSEDDDADNHSAFTISSNDDDSGSSSSDDESVGPSFRKTTKKPGTKKTSSSVGRTTSKPSSTAKPTKTKPKEKTKPNRTKTSHKSSTTAAFRKNRINLTKHTFEEFNQQAFGGALSSVEVTWSNKLNTTAGITRMRGKLGKNNADSRVASIDLATKVIDNEERLRSTLLHEMCHAAQWLVDGCHKPPHGDVFKKWANISMRKIRDVEVTTTHDYEISYKFAWACTGANCNVVIKRHSRSVDVTKQCCGRCKGKLIEIEVPGSKGDVAKGKHTPKKARKASAYSLFVKSESANVRKRLAKERSCTPKSVSQADVMKEVGRLWRIKKEKNENKEDSGLDLTNKLVNMTLDDDAKNFIERKGV